MEISKKGLLNVTLLTLFASLIVWALSPVWTATDAQSQPSFTVGTLKWESPAGIDTTDITISPANADVNYVWCIADSADVKLLFYDYAGTAWPDTMIAKALRYNPFPGLWISKVRVIETADYPATIQGYAEQVN